MSYAQSVTYVSLSPMSPCHLCLPVTYVSGSDKRKNGAGEGIRTLDPDLGKVVLYP